MNMDVLAKAGIEYETGVERFSGHAEIYLKYLRKFPEDEYYRKLLEAVEKQDIEAAFSNAHTLKGTSGNLSLTKLYNSLLNLVEDLRAKDLETAVKKMPAVTAAYEETIAVLKSGALDE